MQFVNPVFLFGLLAIGIPIIIHLFNFRRFKKVYFTNVRFIEEITQQTQKQKQVRHLLVLLMRILAIAAIVLAFARPFIPAAGNLKKMGAQSAVSIFIDNSLSMEARQENGALFDEAKKRSKEIIAAHGTSDVYQVFTNDFEGKYQRFVSKDEALQIIDELDYSPIRRNLSEIYSRQQELLNSAGADVKQAYIISDFQKNITDFEYLKNDSSVLVSLVPLKALQTNNLYIDTCWFNAPVLQKGQNVKLVARIRNISDQPLEKIPLKLMINSTQRGLTNFSVGANTSVDVDVNFTVLETGDHRCVLEISDYPIISDDKLYFSFRVNRQIPVLTIYESTDNEYLRSLYNSDSTFRYQSVHVKSLNYSTFTANDLIILSGLKEIPTGLASELNKYVSNGGNLAVFPGEIIEYGSYKNLFEQANLPSFISWDTARVRCQSINMNNRLFQDVFEKGGSSGETSTPLDLPYVFGYYRLTSSLTSLGDNLITLQNGEPFLSAFQYERGNIYIFVSPPEIDFTSFPRHALFVPTMYRLAFLSRQAGRPYYFLDEDKAIEASGVIPAGDQVLKIRSENQQIEVIPENRIVNSRLLIFPHRQLKMVGNYSLINDNQIVLPLSFNTNRKESDLSTWSVSEISDQLSQFDLNNFNLLKAGEKPLSQTINEMNQGIHLWKWFILLALLFLLGEVVLLRFWI